VLVSHDRHLIGLVCETFWRVADGRVDPFDGDLDEYAAWLRTRGNKPMAEKPAAKVAAPAAAPAAKAKPAPGQGKRIGQLESRLAAIDSECAHIAEELANPALYNSDGGGTVVVLGQRQQTLQKERDALEAEWLALYESAGGA
jgi:ATP-binding cassette subfamily F protein 3